MIRVLTVCVSVVFWVGSAGAQPAAQPASAAAPAAKAKAKAKKDPKKSAETADKASGNGHMFWVRPKGKKAQWKTVLE